MNVLTVRLEFDFRILNEQLSFNEAKNELLN